MFSVDYATLEQIIRQFMHTGIFRAHVTKTRLLSEEGQIELQAKEGTVIACRFVTKPGEIFGWDRWDVQLAKIGVLNWELIPDRAMHSRQITPFAPHSRELQGALSVNNNRSSIPYQTLIPDANQTPLLPMLYRRVYCLIDGKRKFADIALILHKSEQDIDQVIHGLILRRLVMLK